MNSHLMCPKCRCEDIEFQTIEEHKKASLLLILWYIFLFCTVLGILVLIPLLLRKKTQTVTYCICKNCGYRWENKQ